ncbi:molybdate ABC transporter substrate-binding protein [Elioraea rosea]|uniref:molybdate ABC transporter substrate-binding protein n=1 Tax=Elioraea rosea TaxID=2492390 RepID=UPI0011835BA7|nr:molybdate ABC transporter substrate-binding protein [Elioraea rosea]
MLRRSLLALPLLGFMAAAPGAASQEIRVFAAASLTSAFQTVAQSWQAAGNPAVRFSFAASSTLARQIEQGAQANIFASADEAWMNHLAQRNLIVPESRTSILGNSLVLVAPASSGQGSVTIGRGLDLAALLGPNGRIATGDPTHVPVGRYARQALDSLGLWEAAEPRLARADNVRAALLFVERGDAPLGIVYGTDAAATQGVKVIGTFPSESHAAITYPFALVRRGATDEARAFLAYAAGPEAAAIWRRFGFTPRN